MIFNYCGWAFQRTNMENFDLLSMCFLDYNREFREVTITWQSIGRKSIWVAQFSGLTTEYTGNLTEVLDRVIEHCKSDQIKLHNSVAKL